MKLAAFMGDSVCRIGARCLEFTCPSWRDFQHLLLEIHPVLLLALQLLQAAALVLHGLPRYLQKSGIQAPGTNQPWSSCTVLQPTQPQRCFPCAPRPETIHLNRSFCPGSFLMMFSL